MPSKVSLVEVGGDLLEIQRIYNNPLVRVGVATDRALYVVYEHEKLKGIVEK